jgi:hypothetical protein
MPGRTFRLHCTPEQAGEAALALETYALAAYPPGGSECAQVARQALLDSARLIRENGAGADLRKRQRAMLKSGIAWYYSPDGPGEAQRRQEMLALFDKP